MNMSVTDLRDIATIVAALVAAIGATVAVIQLRRNFRVTKAQFVASTAKDFFDDSELRKFFYQIDYEKFSFDLGSFKGSDEERRLDALLYRYNHIAGLVRIKILTTRDIEFILFELAQVFKNSEVRKYIQWLDSEFVKHGAIGTNVRRRPLDDARWLFDQLVNDKGRVDGAIAK